MGNSLLVEEDSRGVADRPAAGQAALEPLKIGVESSHVERVLDREAGMPPIAERGGDGWTCGRHHHRERLRNDRVLRARQDGRARRGVHHHQLSYVRRRQRQQLAPHATSRWRGGANQIALAPREGQALEERSGSSRLAGGPRTRDVQLPYVRRRQRQQLAPRATSRWRLTEAPKEQPERWRRKEDLLELNKGLAQRAAALTRDVHLPFVTRRQRQQLARHQVATGAEQAGAMASSPYEPRARAPSRGQRAAQPVRHPERRSSQRRQRRTPTSRTATAARARGARRFLTEDKKLRRPLEHAAAYQGGQRAGRAS